MSQEYRFKLIDDIIRYQPEVGAFIRNVAPYEMPILSDWDVIAYGFGKAFETLWDHARCDCSGLLIQPLLMLWRQSVELSIKAALVEITGGTDGSIGHNLEALFDRLGLALEDVGYCRGDSFTAVRLMLSGVQVLDRYADRFRYPTAKDGKPFERMDADLDKLFQAHIIITFYCEGAATEVAEKRQISY